MLYIYIYESKLTERQVVLYNHISEGCYPNLDLTEVDWLLDLRKNISLNNQYCNVNLVAIYRNTSILISMTYIYNKIVYCC